MTERRALQLVATVGTLHACMHQCCLVFKAADTSFINQLIFGAPPASYILPASKVGPIDQLGQIL